MPLLRSTDAFSLWRPLLTAAVSSLALCGCGDLFGTQGAPTGGANATVPGTSLGTFNLVGTNVSNTCGSGPPTAPSSPYDFAIPLSVEGSTIYWNNGSAIAGTLAADGVTFAFSVTGVTDMRANTTPTMVDDPFGTADTTINNTTTVASNLPACSISRQDTLTGTLNAATAPTSFTGVLTYTYAPTAGSSCDDLVTATATVPAQLTALSCSFSYSVSATLAAAAP